MLLLLGILALLLALTAVFGPRAVPYRIRSIRLILGTVYFAAGMSKLIPGFPAIIGPVWLEERLAPYGLGLFARFIAVSELAVGVLLLTRRFATLGAIALVPMQVCILMVTLSLHWQGTPEVLAIFLVLNVVLLVYDTPKWKPLFLPDQPRADVPTALQIRRERLSLDLLWVAATALLLGSAAIVPEAAAAKYALALAGSVLVGLTAADWWDARRSAS